LPGFFPRRTEAHPINDIIQSPLEQLEKIFTRDAFLPRGFLEIPAELPLQQPIDPFQLLLLAQLDLIFGDAGAGLPVLPR
jgi:hypothetical protein